MRPIRLCVSLPGPAEGGEGGRGGRRRGEQEDSNNNPFLKEGVVVAVLRDRSGRLKGQHIRLCVSLPERDLL
jgi:hypothetical protein